MMNLVYSQYLFDDFGEHLCFAQIVGVYFVFYDIYVGLCNQKGISPSKAAESVGLSRTSVVKWKAGTIPSGATLNSLAQFFNVTVDYLMGNKQKEKPAQAQAEPEDIAILNRAAKKMTPENRKKLLDMARIMFKEDFEDDK